MIVVCAVGEGNKIGAANKAEGCLFIAFAHDRDGENAESVHHIFLRYFELSPKNILRTTAVFKRFQAVKTGTDTEYAPAQGGSMTIGNDHC